MPPVPMLKVSSSEDVCFNRRPVGQDVFLKHFWDCFNTFRQTSSEEAGMPAYFRFLTLLGKR